MNELGSLFYTDSSIYFRCMYFKLAKKQQMQLSNSLWLFNALHLTCSVLPPVVKHRPPAPYSTPVICQLISLRVAKLRVSGKRSELSFQIDLTSNEI